MIWETLNKVFEICICVLPAIISFVLWIQMVLRDKEWEKIMSVALDAMIITEKYTRTRPNIKREEKLNMAIGSTEKMLLTADIVLNEKQKIKLIEFIDKMCKWHNTMNN